MVTQEFWCDYVNPTLTAPLVVFQHRLGPEGKPEIQGAHVETSAEGRRYMVFGCWFHKKYEFTADGKRWAAPTRLERLKRYREVAGYASDMWLRNWVCMECAREMGLLW